MTTEQLIGGMVNAIYEEFGEEYPIRTENSEQGFQGPCFYVRCVTPAKNLYFWRRYRRTWLMNICYFPRESEVSSPSEPNAEMNDAAERLFDCLEIFQVGDRLVRTTDKQTAVSDGVLVMSARVQADEIRTAPETVMMETQKTELEVEGWRSEKERPKWTPRSASPVLS